MKYSPTIGLEIHIELKTNSKMFCSCKNDPFIKKPNIYICPICLGLPGTLPVLNKKAIEWTVLVALSLQCKIASETKWDRKNYYYPDLPKGYQIAQYDLPLSSNGVLEIDFDGELLPVGIERVHLEEDTAKLIHPKGTNYSLVDFNRAGIPLMEIVTKPDMHSARQAQKFAKDLQHILRYVGVSDADMEKGQMRIEANISISKDDKLGTKVEIKNLNSFRSVEKAIEYEISRQSKVLTEGGTILQETRGWNQDKQETFSQRSKEFAPDYRYFPEPDLPPLKVGKDWLAELKSQIPLLPAQKRQKFFQKYKLSLEMVEILISDKNLTSYFEKVLGLKGYKISPKTLANWMVHKNLKTKMVPEKLAGFLSFLEKGVISESMGREIALEMIKTNKSIDQILKEKGLKLMEDEKQLERVIDGVLKANQKVVLDFKKGKQAAFHFLIGQVMRKTSGLANPKLVNRVLREKLSRL